MTQHSPLLSQGDEQKADQQGPCLVTGPLLRTDTVNKATYKRQHLIEGLLTVSDSVDHGSRQTDTVPEQ